MKSMIFIRIILIKYQISNKVIKMCKTLCQGINIIIWDIQIHKTNDPKNINNNTMQNNI
jgi:hypothetical protein